MVQPGRPIAELGGGGWGGARTWSWAQPTVHRPDSSIAGKIVRAVQCAPTQSIQGFASCSRVPCGRRNALCCEPNSSTCCCQQSLLLHAPCRGNVFVARCDEDLDGEEPGKNCWKLRRSMYGTRPAAQDWQHAVREAMTKIGFDVGVSSPNVLPQRKAKLVHGARRWFLLIGGT